MTVSKRKISPCAVFLAAGFVLTLLLYLAACFISGFADFFTDNVFYYISVPYAFFSSLFPFSFGELLIIIGILIVIIGIPAVIVSAIIIRKNKEKQKKLIKGTAVFLSFVTLFIALTETLNCFVEYRCSTFSQRYMDKNAPSEYSADELSALCDYLIDNANSLAENLPRDSDGYIILPENAPALAGEYMDKFGRDYDIERLTGYYTRPKSIVCSEFMSKANLQGIYFPFTMEANINADMFSSRKPATMCHELAHTKGFIMEDEAGFIAFLACRNSDDPVFMYSGFLSAMTYSVNELYKYAEDDEKVRISEKISPLVRFDNRFLTDEYRKALEEDKIIKKDTVSKASDKALDANLKINGISDGKQSYSRIVSLLLRDFYYPLEKK